MISLHPSLSKAFPNFFDHSPLLPKISITPNIHIFIYKLYICHCPNIIYYKAFTKIEIKKDMR